MNYPADYIVHCVNGPVVCCHNHMQKLVGLQRFMGAHVQVETIADQGTCGNCVNEAKSRGESSASSPQQEKP